MGKMNLILKNGRNKICFDPGGKNADVIDQKLSWSIRWNIQIRQCWETWIKENYDNNKETKLTRFFPSKIYMFSLWSLASKCTCVCDD